MLLAVKAATLTIDILTIAGVLGAMFFFFFKKKSVKLMAIYAAAFVVYVVVLLLDEYFGIPVPIARSLMTAVVWFMIAALAVVYQSDLKVTFFNTTSSFRNISTRL